MIVKSVQQEESSMAHLNDLIKDIVENGVDSHIENASKITKLTADIADRKDAITAQYTKIGETYFKLHADDSEGELAEQIAVVKENEQAIKEDKLKIGKMMGLTFCEECGEQVDEDDLYCNNCGAKMPVKLLPGMELCPHCNKAVKAGIHFCTNCGKPMIEEKKPPVKVCPSCGFTTEDMNKIFCDKCNRRLECDGEEPEEKKKKKAKVATKKVCPACGFSVYDAETMFCKKCNRRLVEKNA